MKERSNHGQPQRLGEGRFEIVRLQLDLDDDLRGRITEDASGVVREFLESAGEVVNRVVVTNPSAEAIADAGWYHIQVPESERSQWIQS